jgi:hypothetical protein
MSNHNFPLDRFRLCYKTPLGNIVDEREANRLAQLDRDKEHAKWLLEHPPIRVSKRLEEIKEAIA